MGNKPSKELAENQTTEETLSQVPEPEPDYNNPEYYNYLTDDDSSEDGELSIGLEIAGENYGDRDHDGMGDDEEYYCPETPPQYETDTEEPDYMELDYPMDFDTGSQESVSTFLAKFAEQDIDIVAVEDNDKIPEIPRSPTIPELETLPEILESTSTTEDIAPQFEESIESSPIFDEENENNFNPEIHQEMDEQDADEVVAAVFEEQNPDQRRLMDMLKKHTPSNEEEEEGPKNPIKTLKDAYPDISTDLLGSFANLGIPISVLVPPTEKYDFTKLFVPSNLTQSNNVLDSLGTLSDNNQDPIFLFKGGASITIAKI